MKNKKQLLPAIAGLLLLLLTTTTACNKKTENNTSALTGKMKTTTQVSGSTTQTFTFIYDDQGRISTLENTVDGKEVFTYTTAQVTQWHYNLGATTPSDTTIYYLDAAGLATHTSKGDTYQFNTDRRMTYETMGTDTSIYTYTNGNFTTRQYHSGSTSGVATYTHLADKLETRNNNGFDFLGKHNTNLINVETDTQSGGTFTTNYTYEYDSNGKITKETTTGASNQVLTYTYY